MAFCTVDIFNSYSHDGVTVNQRVKYQAPESEAAKVDQKEYVITSLIQHFSNKVTKIYMVYISGLL